MNEKQVIHALSQWFADNSFVRGSETMFHVSIRQQILDILVRNSIDVVLITPWRAVEMPSGVTGFAEEYWLEFISGVPVISDAAIRAENNHRIQAYLNNLPPHTAYMSFMLDEADYTLDIAQVTD